MLKLSQGKSIKGRYKIVGFLGKGDAGTVYRVTQLGIGVDRAMKFLDPKLPGVSPTTFKREFLAERSKLSRLTHKNIVKLIDADKYEPKAGEVYPFYVTDLVQPPAGEKKAPTLGAWAKKVKTKAQFVDIILQLTDGLSYLHTHRCLHCDIKPKNVLLEAISGNQYDVKITDFGSSKILPRATTGNTDQTYVIGTVDYAPSYVRKYLNQKKQVTIQQLQEWFPHFDLFCMGATLAEIVSTRSIEPGREFKELLDNPKENIRNALGGDFDVLKQVILRLVDKDMRNCFPNVHSVAEAFRKFKPEYILPLGVEEMAVGGAHRTLTLPTKKVYISERAYSIVEHGVFQRLHQLNQLNFVYMLYSGAKHSRFTHSLATYEMAKRYIEGLLGDGYFKYLMYQKDFELFLAAALLHDIGQYPLAHAIEDLRDVSLGGVSSGIRADYEMARHFLKWEDVRSGKTISDLLRRAWGLEPDAVVRVVAKGKAASDSELLIQSMLDGPIDVDKVSYLQDDSYFTGAPYGSGIDLDGLLSSLVAVPPLHSTKRQTQLGVSDDGIVAAEGVIAARYSMFSRVYWHHFNRAIMAMITYAAARVFLSPLPPCTFDGYIKETFGCSDLEAIRYLSKCFDALRRNSSEKIANPLHGLLDGTRTVHRRFLTFSGRTGSETATIHAYLTQRDFGSTERLRKDVLRTLQKFAGVPLKDSDVLFDVPRARKTHDNLKPLYVRDPEDAQEYKTLADLSGVV